IAASRTYVTIWTRARLLDVLMLSSTLLTGLVLSLGIALLIDPGTPWEALLRALVVGAVSHPAIVIVRVFYRLIEESVTYLRNKSEIRPENGKILIYGTGGRCQVFLKERGLSNSRNFDGQPIVGLIDDETSLQGQWVYGYPVLGGIG